MYTNLEDKVMKARFIISTAKGFICDAEWVNGRTYPESYGFSHTSAQTFTHQRAKLLERLCFDNWLDDVKLIKVL